MNAATIANALDGHKAGGGWLAPCPAHDDRVPNAPMALFAARQWHSHARDPPLVDNNHINFHGKLSKRTTVMTNLT
jgi:hypothetical protein